MRVSLNVRILTVFILTVGILVIGGYYLVISDFFQKKYIYPFYYQDIVYHWSLEYEIEPFLVASIIKNESKFEPNAISVKGAAGLMQLMPETAAWIAKQARVKEYSADKINDPETNIRLGTWYIDSLKNEFEGNEILMLAAYNGGRGNVKQWMQQYGWTMEFSDINQIPFLETRNYVKKVIRDKKRYQELYD